MEGYLMFMDLKTKAVKMPMPLRMIYRWAIVFTDGILRATYLRVLDHYILIIAALNPPKRHFLVMES